MKFINSKIHGLIDYIVVAFLVFSPVMFEFTDFVATFTYTIAGIHLTLTLVTDFKAGLFKIVPLPIHGAIEFFVGIFLFASPWIFGFSEHSPDKMFYMVFGLAVLLTFTFTQYKEN